MEVGEQLDKRVMTEEEFQMEIRKFRPISLLTALKPQLDIIDRLKPVPKGKGKVVEFVKDGRLV